MAEYALIDGYLETLRTSVRWRRDVDDIVAEMEDHLYSAVERFEAIGTDRRLAQRQTLDRFGDPGLVANALASTSEGGIAVPTTFTKTAGLAGMWSGVLMIGLPIAWTLGLISEERSGSWDRVESTMFAVGTAALLAAAALIVVLMVGLNKRHGGLGTAGIVGLGLAALGVVLAFIAWFIFGWGVLLGSGMLIYAIAMLRRDIAPRADTVAFGSGMLIGLIVFFVLTALEVGWRDSYGDYPLAFLVGVWSMSLVSAVGLIGLGRWLRSEEPADIEPAEPFATS